MPDEPARVDTGEDRDLIVVQPFPKGPLRSPVERIATQLTGDERSRPRPARFEEGGAGPIVPDQRIGHDHHLARVGRVGEHLLIARHTGVEDELAAGVPGVSSPLTLDGEAVLKDEHHGLVHRFTYGFTAPRRAGRGTQVKARLTKSRTCATLPETRLSGHE